MEEEMKAELYLKNADRYDLTIFTKVLTENGYAVKYEKGDRLKTKVEITKNEPEEVIVLINGKALTL